ncbi:hypothetical protein H6P81_001932 [Aristolochia fimbriata]|uniref:RNA exonuclease 4 n=1 Tax=Aristolochia fimbriata TaxID=158543 RepID=A0AAV7F8X9_ARIFI|nr:hypothetical protein H6P81_001932 [Aristolochia fimbriata]
MDEQKAFMNEESKATKSPNVRHKCSACFKQYKKKEHLVAHMRVANHSVHQPQCGVCQKYCKSFESLREHLYGPLQKACCSKIYRSQGCDLCLSVFESFDALDVHKEKCHLYPFPALGHAPVNSLGNSLESVEDVQMIEADNNNINEIPKAVAMDCEMVGGGSDGTLDICGRVCLIDEDENVIFHSYVIPQIPITNFRHEITGITEDNLRDARPLKQVREKIEEILHNGEALWRIRLQGGKARVLVGHSVDHDLDCLQMNYPNHLRRDTACYPPLMKTNLASHSLKYLAKTYLGYEIQSGVHDPYEDCVAAMRLYRRMRAQSVCHSWSLSRISLAVHPNASASIGTARGLFDEMLEKDQVSWNSIISGYVYNGDVASARELFEEMPVKRSVVAWTALIDGYGKQGMVVEMFRLFRRMIVAIDNVKPNSSLVCLLSSCSDNSYLKLGRWVSVFIDVNRIPLDIILSTALIGSYARSGDVDKARRIFDGTPNKTLATWNAMITGCVHGGLFEEAIQLFYIMRRNRVRPDEITMVNVLSACAGLGALELGREIHLYLGRSRLLLNEILATALVDMYSKCGSIKDACLVFVKSTEKDVVLWNAMIVGLATHGHGRDSLAVFSQMERSRMQPNEVTFIGVLSACAHSGLVEDGRAKFDIMQARYNLKPKIEHYSCMVDLLGRAGHLKEAMDIVKSMNVEPDSIVWGSLLSACGIHQNVELADEVGKIILLSESLNVGCCILLSNIYASSNRWKDVARVRRLMKSTGMKKPSGCSWIEVDGVVNSFLVEESAHPRHEDIYEMHDILVNQLMFEGYTHNPDFLLMEDDGT